MSIDERLQFLAARHEALTQSVELISLENTRRDQRLGEIMEGIARLLHVAGIPRHPSINQNFQSPA